MAGVWSVSKALQAPLHSSIKELHDLPFTISFVIRKRMQIDNLNELPKEKRPTEKMIWEGTSEDIESWIERVFDHGKKTKTKTEVEFIIKDDEIEG